MFANNMCVITLIVAVALPAHNRVTLVDDPWDLEKHYYRSSECGPIALWCVCRYLGVDTTITKLASASDYDGRTTSILGIIKAGESVGLKGTALTSSVQDLRNYGGPAIVDRPRGHFAVFLGWDGDRIVVFDPPTTVNRLNSADFGDGWGGHLIVFSRSREFKGHNSNVAGHDTGHDGL